MKLTNALHSAHVPIATTTGENCANITKSVAAYIDRTGKDDQRRGGRFRLQAGKLAPTEFVNL